MEGLPPGLTRGTTETYSEHLAVGGMSLTHSHVDVCTHTYMHTHIHTYTYTQSPRFLCYTEVKSEVGIRSELQRPLVGWLGHLKHRGHRREEDVLLSDI